MTDRAGVTGWRCQPLFADILGQGNIVCETGQASVQQASVQQASVQQGLRAVLDNLTAIAMRCPDAHDRRIEFDVK